MAYWQMLLFSKEKHHLASLKQIARIIWHFHFTFYIQNTVAIKRNFFPAELDR
jgi:hypothetical protein